MAQYYYIPNLSSTVVGEIAEPWNWEVPQDVLDMPPETFKRAYSLNRNTEHRFLSLCKGANPNYRVTKDNEAVELGGFFADYDGVFVKSMIDELRERPIHPKFLPTWWVETVSGHLRLVWEAESPVRVIGNDQAKDLISHFFAAAKVAKWGSELDVRSKDPTQYMDIGRKWHRFSDSLVSRDLLDMWAIELAVKRSKVYSGSTVTIPFDTVRELCRARFGEQMPSDFQVGTRCRRFWDAKSDNPTGCVVTEDGCFVFVPHDKPFMTWGDILGADVVEEYTSKQVSPMLRKCFYCPSGKGGVYWRLRDDGMFVPAPKTTFEDDLLNLTDISPDKPKGGTRSPMDEFLFKVREQKTVDCAAPILFDELKDITIGGQRILNVSRVAALAPAPSFPVSVTDEDLAAYPDAKKEYKLAPDTCAWDNPFVVRTFPNIHRYLTMFCMPNQAASVAWEKAGFPLHDPEDEGGDPVRIFHDKQFVLLISWLSYFYKQAVHRRRITQPGQALILAGGAGLGKTFFAEQIVGGLVGGTVNAKDYFLDGTSFTDDITDHPVLLLDDVVCDVDYRVRAQFTTRVKTLVATAKLRHHAKFQTPVNIPYRGRLIVCCNDDPTSLSVLPNLDASTSDKMIMLRLGNVREAMDRCAFGTFEGNMAWVRSELPYFARFLMNWQIPEEMRDSRFGVKAYQHEAMKQAVASHGSAHVVTEILVKVFEPNSEIVTADPDGSEGAFRGTATDLMASIKMYDHANDTDFAREIGNLPKLQFALKQMKKAYPAITSQFKRRVEEWYIPYNFTEGSEI
jgi:hypothetical protein